MKKWIYIKDNSDWRGHEPEPKWNIFEELTPQEIRFNVSQEIDSDDDDFEDACKDPAEFSIDVYENEDIVAVAYSEEFAQEIVETHNQRVSIE